MIYLTVNKLGIITLCNHLVTDRKMISFHHFKIGGFSLFCIGILCRSGYKKNIAAMMFLNQVHHNQPDSLFVVTDQRMAVWLMHDFCEKYCRNGIKFQCKLLGAFVFQLKSECTIIDDQTIKSTNQTVIVNCIKLIVKRILMCSAKHILEKVFCLRSEKETDIGIQFFCCLCNSKDVFLRKICMYTTNQNPNIISPMFFHVRHSSE